MSVNNQPITGFDAYETKLGDIIRGERATLCKTLDDVQKDLRIKRTFIEAIENADISVFDTPSFVPGFVRSYARYLGLDEAWMFDKFCAETGFNLKSETIAAPLSRAKKKSGLQNKPLGIGREPLQRGPIMPDFMALGSVSLMIGLIGAAGFGIWTVLQELQKVRLGPVDSAPVIISELDIPDAIAPQVGLSDPVSDPALQTVASTGTDTSEPALRLYRPEALDAPIMIARDGPIARLDPGKVGALSSKVTEIYVPENSIEAALSSVVQVVEPAKPNVSLVAVSPTWVSLKSGGGTTVFEGILSGGDRYDVPQDLAEATLRVGESGALFFDIDGVSYGPAGKSGEVTSNIPVSAPDALIATYQVADLTVFDNQPETSTALRD